MTPLLLFLAADVQTPAPAAAHAAVRDEIVVIGDRLKRWSAKFEVRGARSRCTTKTSSGDAAVDAIGCASFEACLPALQPRIDASDRRDLDKRERIAMKAAIKRDLTACVIHRRDELTAELAERRFQARQGSKDASN